MANKRIFYACQAVAITTQDGSVGAGNVMKGVQSVGINTNISLDQVFELGQAAIYENIEEVAEVEVTIEKVLDGHKLLYNAAAPSGGTDIVAASAEECDVYLAIYADSANAIASTNKVNVVACPKMVVGSVSYSWTVDGTATESVTLVGNDKVWNTQASDLMSDNADTKYADGLATGIDGSHSPLHAAAGSGVVRRSNVYSHGDGGADWPAAVLTNGTAGSRRVQSISMSADFGRENILELGSFGPYCKYASFPFEVSAEFEVVSSGGDLVNVSGTGKNLGAGETITVTDQAGTVVSGDNFKLTGVSYSGGDTGGGNASVTFSYSTFNSFTATNPSA